MDHWKAIMLWFLTITVVEGALDSLETPWGKIVLFNLAVSLCGVLDYYYGRLFNSLTALLALMGLVVMVLDPALALAESLAGAGVFGSSLLLIRWLSRGGMGTGDVKFGAAAGIWLGPVSAVTALNLAFWLGAVYALWFWYKRGNFKWEARKMTIPFGPCLAWGSSLAMAFGGKIMAVCLGLV